MEMQIVFPGGSRVDAVAPNLTIATGKEDGMPRPFDLFLASIGTCAGIYVLGFCRKRNLPTDGITIVQRLRSNPATHMIEAIELEIRVPPNFPEKYRDALIRVADQCKVKKHLEQPPAFDVHTTVAA